MKDIRKLTYKDFYYISLDEFYTYVVTIMKNLNYTFYRRVKDTSTRRAEIWKLFDSEEYKVIVWIEILEPSLELTWQEAAGILRLMNDENITKLFLFTNGNLDAQARDVLDDEEHFIFTTRQIIERLLSFEKYNEEAEEETKEEKKIGKKEEIIPIEEVIVEEKKRERISDNTGYILIAKYLKNKGVSNKKVNIPLSEILTLVTFVLDLYKDIDQYEKNINDLDNLDSNEIKSINKKIKTFLPLFYKLRNTKIDKEYLDIRADLIDFVKYVIYYLSGIKNYELLENIENYKGKLTELLERLKGVNERFYNQLNMNISESTLLFEKLIKYSVIFIILCIVLAILIL